mmetsp:Transcript_19577/g.35526  ORF Transcript_19577/g.35526 Transcript_19577/m.35526 type:complete len:303 (+) Transcript_19577:852-1760(+)
MRNIVVRHRKNRKLGNGTVSAHHTSGTLINGRQIGVHITGVTTTSRDLLTSSRHLTKGVSVRTHISKNDQHVQITLVCQVLSSGKRETWCNNTFNGRIIGQVKKEGSTLHGTTFLEIGTEETSSFHVHSHGTEHNGEILLMAIHGVLLLNKRGLTGNLGSDFVVRKTGGRKDRNLLSACHRVHHINGRDTSLDHGLGVITRRRVDGLTVNIKVRLSQHLGGRVNHLSRSVKGSSKHLLRNSHFEHIASELAPGLPVVDARSSLKHLHNSARARYLQHLSRAGSTISQSQINNLGKLGQLNIV